MQNQFKVNDWCFCEYELQQIIEIEEGRITSVTTGMCRLSGYDLSDMCFPLDIRIKNISDTVAYYMKKLHEVKHLNLNYPDLNRAFISRWVDLCKVKDDDKALQIGYDNLSAFYQSIIDKVSQVKNEYVEGVQLFR